MAQAALKLVGKEDTDKQRALEAGFDEYLAKPLRPAVLVQAVVAIVERKLLLRAM